MPLEEFKLESSENYVSSIEEVLANLWICSASKMSFKMYEPKFFRELMYEVYAPIPYKRDNFEPMEWPHCLDTSDVSTENCGAKLCDLDLYDIISF